LPSKVGPGHKSETVSKTQMKAKMVHMVEFLPSNLKAQSSNPTTTKNRKEKKKSTLKTFQKQVKNYENPCIHERISSNS
jgi:hypothetical protein